MEVVSRAAGSHEFDLFAPVKPWPELPPADDGLVRRLESAVGQVSLLAAGPERTLPLLSARAFRPIVALTRVRAAEAMATRLINMGRYDAVLVAPCQVTQAPALIANLVPPTVYAIHEGRRRSIEPGYRSAMQWRGERASKGLRRLPVRARRAAGRLWDLALGAQDRRAVRAATALGCNSRYTAEVVSSIYGRAARVIPPGVDAEVFALKSGPPGTQAISVGGLDPTKGHDLAIRGLAALPIARRPALDIVFERALDGYQIYLEGLARDLQVEVSFHRQIRDRRLAQLYGAAGVTICAAHLEPFGLTALESMAVGTPVVAVREGGFVETVEDGLTGWLVARDAESIARGIIAIQDGKTARPEVIRGRATAWSWDRTASEFCELLESVANPVISRTPEP
ncbi:MAG: glycosyltransferase [Candidatus Dormibacteria bacterium]